MLKVGFNLIVWVTAINDETVPGEIYGPEISHS